MVHGNSKIRDLKNTSREENHLMWSNLLIHKFNIYPTFLHLNSKRGISYQTIRAGSCCMFVCAGIYTALFPEELWHCKTYINYRSLWKKVWANIQDSIDPEQHIHLSEQLWCCLFQQNKEKLQGVSSNMIWFSNKRVWVCGCKALLSVIPE